MSTVWVECWKCDECGHRWIKGETWPSHCASSKCRKRSWNKDAVSRARASDVKKENAGGDSIKLTHHAENVPQITAPKLETSKMNPAMAALLSKPAVIASELVLPNVVEFTRCPLKEWSEVDACNLQCKLAIGHRGDCIL